MMIASELDAAAIHDPRLRAAYRRCRTLNARHGRTFFLATRLLAPAQRPAVHALYGWARWVDDILDGGDAAADAATRAARLQRLDDELRAADRCAREPVVIAVSHTVSTYRISLALFDDFLASMRMDLTVTDYPDRAALNRYIRGSAEAIGLQLLPVLGTVCSADAAAPYAAALGRAFQLTNFLRDIDEDLARDRVYLPADELAAFGVDRELLTWCHQRRRCDPRVRQALAAQHHITRDIYRFARQGIALLSPPSRPCIWAALTLYSEILDRIEDSGFAVFGHRASVGTVRRVQVAAAGWARARRARNGCRTLPAQHRSDAA